MKAFKLIALMLVAIVASANLSSCSDDEEDAVNNANKEIDGTLLGEWIEDSGNRYVFDYYCFYSDGTGIHGSWESDIDWVNEDDDIEWYTVDRKYLYINGTRYEYSCDGSTLEINMNGRTRHYYEK